MSSLNWLNRWLVGTASVFLTLCCSAQNAEQPADAKSQTPEPFEFRDGDRVAFLGDTLIERDQTYGYVETRLTARYPDRHITFRNLGWSADTVSGQSRVSFDWNKLEEEWLKQLIAPLAEFKPTVVFLGYGMAHSFDGEAGLPKFKAGLERLMDRIQGITPGSPVRFILLSPLRHEKLGPPWPDPAPHDAQLALYSEVIQEIAEKRKQLFISLRDLLPDGTQSNPPFPLTENGIHLSAVGYWRLAEAIEIGLGWLPNTWRLGLMADGKPRPGSQFLNIENVERRADYVRFTGLADYVEQLQAPGDDAEVPRRTPPNLLQVHGLKPGTYILKIDGHPMVANTEKFWARGQAISGGPAQEHAEKLRQTILRKNELFFHRWRPQNQTYLFGFRKHEQGQNAREIPMFDPLIEEQEKLIAELRKPVARTYELVLYTDESVLQAPATPAAPAKPSDPTATPTTPGSEKPSGSESSAQPRPRPTFEVADGLEIQLYAENPLLAKPIQMNFDAQGRLWVASSAVYPQIEPGQIADDKILILEDTDHDGTVDKSTVFADGLLIPTGVEPGDGGAYVGQSTKLLHFKDTNGDGRADQKRIVLSSFGTEDTHHIIHTLRWGHDGQLYFNQSIYIHTHIETPHGVVRLNSGGIMHLRPANQQLGIFVKGFVNTWGHDFDAFGQSFITDGAYGEGINYGLPGAMYVTYAGARRILGSVSPGSYPKFCGLEIVSSGHFPEDWQGNLITCDFRAHRVVRFAISEQGSAYVTREMPDVVRSTDVTFRPIDVKVGPDGALYIADWSNPIIQHGEVDFRDPRRDHERGRIWRVTAKGRSTLPKPDLLNAGNSALLNELLSPNAYNARRARRILTERGSAIVDDLTHWTKAQATERASLEALWMYQALDVVEPALLQKLLAAQDHRVRAAAVRVLRFWFPHVDNPVDHLAKAVQDEHPRARLEAMRALSQIPTARSAELVLGALDKPMDRFLDYALWLSINDLAKPWIEAVRNGDWKIEGREQQLEFALQAIEPSLAGSVLSQLIESGTVPKDGSGPWFDLIGKAGTARELRWLFEQSFQDGLDASAKARALAALDHAARVRNLRPEGDLASVSRLFRHADAAVRREASRLAGSWKLSGSVRVLLEMAGDSAADPSLREAAFQSLRNISGSEALQGLETLAAKDKAEAVRIPAVQALAQINFNRALPRVLEVLVETRDDSAALGLWRSLLANKGAAAILAQSLSKASLPSGVAQAGLRAAREGGRNEPDLILAIARSGNLEETARELTPAEIQQLVANVREQGDPARGELVYRRADLSCLTCHAIGGVGGKAGPDLTSIGASAPVDYLIESLLYPNRKVKEGFHSVIVETKDGLEITGLLVRETSEQLVLRDPANREISVAKNSVQNRIIGGSIMPSGLIDHLSSQEQIDLVRFLSELGKPGPYDASQGRVARHWRLLPATIDAAQFGDERVLQSNFSERGWSAAFSYVDGRLPKAELQAKLDSVRHRDPSALYAAAQFQTAQAGAIELKLGGQPVQAIWLNGRRLAPNSTISATVEAGLQTCVIKLNADELPEAVRLETSDGTFLTE